MRLLFDLHKLQGSMPDKENLRLFLDNMVREETAKTDRQISSDSTEVYVFYDFAAEMEVCFSSMEGFVTRDKVKTMCFYPVTDSNNEDDREIRNLFRKWFCHQFLADAVFEIGCGASSEALFIKRVELIGCACSIEELCGQMRPLIKGKTEDFMALLACSVADSILFRTKQTVFVDVTASIAKNVGTEIRRVVNGFAEGLQELFSNRDGEEVSAIFYDEYTEFFRAGQNGSTWTRKSGKNETARVQFHDGDVLFFPGVLPEGQEEMENCVKSLKNRGVNVAFFLHDLFPVYYPERLNHSDELIWFNSYLRLISGASTVIGNSKTTLENYLCWCADCNITHPAYFRTGFAYPGCDIEKEIGEKEIPADAEQVLKDVRSETMLMMVGSIAQGKNHECVINAMELLWEKGNRTKLVFVGACEKNMEIFAQKLRMHPESGKRFFWLSEVSDEFLAMLYRCAGGIICVPDDEGYSLSFAEAAAYGKPVIVRDIPIFREIAGENATYYRGGRNAAKLEAALETWIKQIKEETAVKPDCFKRYSWLESSEILIGKIDCKNLDKEEKR